MRSKIIGIFLRCYNSKFNASPEVDVGIVGVGGGDVGEYEIAEGLAVFVEPANHNDLLAPVTPVAIETLNH